MKHGILVVDDESDIVDSLERQFRKTYDVYKATSGAEALKLLQQHDVSLIISDQRMPEMSGVQLLERAQKVKPHCLRILLTGFTDVSSIIEAINKGQIYRYITKPWDPTELGMVVDKAIETFELKNELRIKNQQLEAALEDLKVLDQAKSHFMLLIGHELKTPLTTLRSFTDLLLEEKLSEDQNKYVTRVSQGIDRLTGIVFDVLDLMGAETKNTKVTKGSTRVHQTVSEVITTLTSAAEARNVSVDCKDSKLIANYDPSLIKKVLTKIIDNAIKFSPEGSPVTIEITDQKNQGIEVSVANKGPTIPKEKINRLLEPFTLDEDIMNHTQGVGLGLSVAFALLEHHGSPLSIDSGSSGTRVGFTLEAK